jgi:hypothetical protein
MPYDFTAITTAVVAAADQKPGHSDVIFFSPIDQFLVLQKPAAFAVAGDKKKITTAHTFTAPAGFVRIKCKPGSVKEDGSGIIGEKGGLVPRHVYNFIVKGHSAVIEETLEEMLNIEAVYLFNSPECGVNSYVQLGSECNPAQITSYVAKSGSRGEGGVREYEVVLESSDKYFYSSTVTEAS